MIITAFVLTGLFVFGFMSLPEDQGRDEGW